MADGLKIRIGADTIEVKKSLADLESQLKRFQSSLRNATDPQTITRLNTAIQRTQQIIQGVKSAGLDNALNKIPSAANAANVALINTGRVFQDLPFGIIGVANNINPLLESFQRLSQQSKETGTSILTNLVGALKGGGGLGLAVSAVTAAASFAAIGFSAFTRGLSGAKTEADNLSASLGDLKNILDGLNLDEKLRIRQSQRPTNENIRALQQELAITTDKKKQADLRVRIAQQEQNELIAQRQFGYEKLKDLDSKFQSKQASDLEKINNLSKKFITSGGAQFLNPAFIDDEEKRVKKEAELKEESNKNLQDYFKQREGIVFSIGDIEQKLYDKTNDVSIAIIEKQKELNKTNEEFKKILQDLSNTLRTISGKEVLFGGNLNPERVDAIKTAIESLLNIGVSTTNQTIQELRKQVIELQKILPKAESGATAKNPLELFPTVTGKQTGKPVTGIRPEILQQIVGLQDLKDKAQQAADIFNTTLGPAITNSFQAAITGTQSFAQAFTQALKGLVVQLIATIAKALILAAILSAVFPAGKGGLGFLGAFKNILGGGKGFAGGGIASGPQSGYFALLHGTEAIFNKDQMKALGSLISRPGEQMFIPNYKLAGEDIFVSFTRVAQRRGRNF